MRAMSAAPALQIIVPSPRAGLRDDCWRLDRICCDALRDEAMAWPKPGLVTPADSGSHRDMTIDTLLASIDALRGYFASVALAGARGADFALLAAIGRDAEARMLRATGGVNTHRGAIFNLGLLVAAAARRHADTGLRGEHCGSVVARRWGESIMAARGDAPGTHGNAVFARHHAGGARAEARSGFASVYELGLPTLRELQRRGVGDEAALIGVLMALTAQLTDTNLLWRGGAEGLAHAQQAAAAFNAAGGVLAEGWRQKLIDMHADFVARNLSPGGAADLVAATRVAFALERFGFSS